MTVEASFVQIVWCTLHIKAVAAFFAPMIGGVIFGAKWIASVYSAMLDEDRTRGDQVSAQDVRIKKYRIRCIVLSSLLVLVSLSNVGLYIYLFYSVNGVVTCSEPEKLVSLQASCEVLIFYALVLLSIGLMLVTKFLLWRIDLMK